ncbi:cytochrome P450 [Nemania sp. FL0916]|nr:cytochrome P450 [Nemania sp. FL0916]
MALLYIAILSICLVTIVTNLSINWGNLRGAPGPFLAKFTDLWRAYQLYHGNLREKLLELHSRHGSIVRYGVRSISINDPEVIKVAYGSRAGFITADSYKVLLGHQNGKDIESLASIRDEKRHGALRRSVANAFTSTAALDYEKWIDVTIEEFLVSVSKKDTFDAASMALWYAMDSSARFSFGVPLGCLTTEEDVGGFVQLTRDRLHHWVRWSSYPKIERLLYRNSIFKPATRVPLNMVAIATEKLEARSNCEKVSEKDPEGVVAPDLLQRFLEASKDFPQALDRPGILGMLMSTITGAGDTTASVLGATLFYILKNQAVLERLEAEFKDAGLREIPAFAEVKMLPYLNAVIKESMRMFSSGAFPMERRVPAGGATIARMYFPEGTTVGCMPAAIHRNKEVFGEDVEVFRPDRWLINDREQLRVMEASHMSFSRGRKNCIGQNIATLSMKKVIPALIMKFKLRLVDPDISFKADYSASSAVLAPIYVNSEIKH